MFIRKVDQSVNYEAEIAQLRAQLSQAETRAKLAEARALQSQQVVQKMEDDCPECQNLCALDQEVLDCECDLLKVQSVLNGELRECGKWAHKFSCMGLEDEFCLMREMITAQLRLKEYELAIASHNLAYCRSQNAVEYMACKKDELIAAAESNENIDDRCLNYINQILVLACA